MSLLDRLAEPVLEARGGDARVVARGEGPVVQLGAEVAGVHVRNHLAGIVVCAQDTPGELVEAERLGAGQLDRVVQWRPDRDIGQGRDHVVGRLGAPGAEGQANVTDLVFLHRHNPFTARFWDWRTFGEAYVDTLDSDDQQRLREAFEIPS